jgi:hypothetical protein
VMRIQSSSQLSILPDSLAYIQVTTTQPEPERLENIPEYFDLDWHRTTSYPRICYFEKPGSRYLERNLIASTRSKIRRRVLCYGSGIRPQSDSSSEREDLHADSIIPIRSENNEVIGGTYCQEMAQ